MEFLNKLAKNSHFLTFILIYKSTQYYKQILRYHTYIRQNRAKLSEMQKNLHILAFILLIYQYHQNFKLSYITYIKIVRK